MGTNDGIASYWTMQKSKFLTDYCTVSYLVKELLRKAGLTELLIFGRDKIELSKIAVIVLVTGYSA